MEIISVPGCCGALLVYAFGNSDAPHIKKKVSGYINDNFFKEVSEGSGNLIIQAYFRRPCNYEGKVSKETRVDKYSFYTAFCDLFKAKIRTRCININTGNEILLVSGKISKTFIKEALKDD